MSETGKLVSRIVSPEATLADKHAAFEALVVAFQDMAFGCAYAILGDFHLAEDASQRAFLSAWQNIHQLREPEAFPGWFKRIVITACNRLTRNGRWQTESLDGHEPRAMSGNPQTKLEHDELRRSVFAAVENLPLSERIVVTLFYLDEKSHAHISAFLDVPVTTVAKRLYLARARLKGKMMSRFKKDISDRRPSRNAAFAKKVRAGLYDEYVGRYKFELRPDLVVTIARDGERLISESTSGQRNELFARHRKKNELSAAEFDGRGEFVRGDDGSISHLVYFEFGKEMGIAKKIA